MKTTTLLTIGLVLAAGIIAPLQAAPPSLLERRAALVEAKTTADAEAAAAPADTDLAAVAASRGQDLTAFDTGNAALLGADWLSRWQNSSYDHPDDEAIDIYIGGRDSTGTVFSIARVPSNLHCWTTSRPSPR